MTALERGALRGHKDAVLSVTTLGNLLLSCSEDKTARLWDLRCNKTVRCLVGFPEEVSCGLFVSSKTVIASSGSAARAFDLRSPKMILADFQTQFLGHSEEINDLALSPDGQRLAACDDNGVVNVFDVSSIGEASLRPIQSIQAHDNICTAVKFGPRSRVVSGGLDCTITSRTVASDDTSAGRVTSKSTRIREESTQQMVNPPFVNSIDVFDAYFLVALGDGLLHVYEQDAEEFKLSEILIGHTGSVACAEFSRFSGLSESIRRPSSSGAADASHDEDVSMCAGSKQSEGGDGDTSTFSSGAGDLVFSAGNDLKMIVWDRNRYEDCDDDDEESKSENWRSPEYVAEFQLPHKPNSLTSTPCGGNRIFVADTSNAISYMSLR